MIERYVNVIAVSARFARLEAEAGNPGYAAQYCRIVRRDGKAGKTWRVALRKKN